MPTLLDRLRKLVPGASHPSPASFVNQLSYVPVEDNTFYAGGSTAADLFRDRLNYDRLTVLAETLRAWRTNPLARWLVQLTQVFVLGSGIEWECADKAADAFLRSFWDHPLNLLPSHLPAWLDEQTRSGDLFLLFSVDDAGMSYVRAVPSEMIKEIQTRSNDYQQETAFIPGDLHQTPWMAYDPQDKDQRSFMLHFPINQPVGCQFGESDLSPLLPWIGRLSTLVSDRVILHHVRSQISFVLQGRFTDSAAKIKRQREIELHPPKQGSILVTDESEIWSVLESRLGSQDASNDILAVKKLIAVGMGVPLHYLAEPESSTRTTAEAAGTPAFKRFNDRQRQFKQLIHTILQVALVVRSRTDKSIKPEVKITINAGDITERDNNLLALAAARIQPALADLYDRDLIAEPEYLRLFYRMMGEILDESKVPTRGKKKDLNARPERSSGREPGTLPSEPNEEDQQEN